MKIAPIAAYEPSRRQTSSKGFPFMDNSINRQLMEINPRLLHVEHSALHHQLMVEKMADRLKNLMDSERLSYEKFGIIAGVSPQAVQKWIDGGDIKPGPLAKLAAHFKTTPAAIRYGDERRPVSSKNISTASELSPIAIDVARRWMNLSSERQEWIRDLIFTTHWMEARFPAMKKGRPKGESYNELESAFEKDMRQLKLKLE